MADAGTRPGGTRLSRSETAMSAVSRAVRKNLCDFAASEDLPPESPSRSPSFSRQPASLSLVPPSDALALQCVAETSAEMRRGIDMVKKGLVAITSTTLSQPEDKLILRICALEEALRAEHHLCEEALFDAAQRLSEVSCSHLQEASTHRSSQICDGLELVHEGLDLTIQTRDDSTFRLQRRIEALEAALSTDNLEVESVPSEMSCIQVMTDVNPLPSKSAVPELPDRSSRISQGSLLEQSRKSSRTERRSLHQRETIMDRGKDAARHAQGTAQTTNMFADAENMRKQIHKELNKEEYDVSSFYYDTGLAQLIARNQNFGMLTLVVIFLNSLWIGYDTDQNTVEGFNNMDMQFKIGEHFFCVCFTFEWLVRFFAFRQKRDGFRDRWFCFDSALVWMMVAETWIMPNIMTPGDGAGTGQLSLLRMMRLLRLTRMVRLMRSVPELVTLLRSMAIASRSVLSTLGLLVIFMYVFAIIFKSQLENTKIPWLVKEMSTIPSAMWRLFFHGILVDAITPAARSLREESPLLSIVFIFFVFLSSLTVLNMLIGILFEVVSAVANAEKEKVLVLYVKNKLMGVLRDLDEDGNGTISKVEFDKLLEKDDAKSALTDLNVDIKDLLSLSDHIFEDEDVNKMFETKEGRRSSGQPGSETEETSTELTEEDFTGKKDLDFAEFLEIIIRLRADQSPSVTDIVNLRKLILTGQRLMSRRCDSIVDRHVGTLQDLGRLRDRLGIPPKWADPIPLSLSPAAPTGVPKVKAATAAGEGSTDSAEALRCVRNASYSASEARAIRATAVSAGGADTISAGRSSGLSC